MMENSLPRYLLEIVRYAGHEKKSLTGVTKNW